jgi:hypothetical protein
MKPEFAEIPVECWEHVAPGLGTQRPTVCMLHANVRAGEELLRALNELKAAGPAGKRMLTFQPCQRKRGVSSLKFLLTPGREDLRVVCIRCAEGAVFIEMTMQGLELLHRAIASWLEGGEDFCVSPSHRMKRRELGSLDRSSGSLWFWGPTMEP